MTDINKALYEDMTRIQLETAKHPNLEVENMNGYKDWDNIRFLNAWVSESVLK